MTEQLRNSPERLSARPAVWVDGRWVNAGRAPGLGDASSSPPGSFGDGGPPGLQIPFRWELGAYVLLFSVALIMRMWDLGTRAIHHDESLHGAFAFSIYQGDGYVHSPLTHGMFLFELVAASFFLFGDSDVTLRLPMAVFGSVLVLVPLLLRPRLGQVGTLIAAVLLAFSPALLYFSRFARNDILMAVFALALVGVMWRYIDERKNRWLFAAAALLALGFTTKETMYITVATLLAFLAWSARKEVWQWIMGRLSVREFGPYGGFLVVAGAIVLPLFAASIGIIQSGLGVTVIAPDQAVGHAPGEPVGTAGYATAIAVTLSLLVAGLAVGIVWGRRLFAAAAAIFWAIFVVVFTTLGDNPGGVATGVWQSLGYWLAQHEVERGSQPWYYFFIVSSVYEFLPFGVAAAATLYYVARSGWKPWAPLVLAGIAFLVLSDSSVSFREAVSSGSGREDVLTGVGTVALAAGVLSLLALPWTLRTSHFKRFLVFWALATFIAYSLAGEKMPWLLVNVTLPMIILAASALNDVVQAVSWKAALRRGMWAVALGVPTVAVLLWRLTYASGDANTAAGFTELWIILAILGLLLLGFWSLNRSLGARSAFGGLAVSVALFMLAFTVRAGWIATYVNGDVPRDMLIYTQTAPDLRQVALDIAIAAELTGDRESIAVEIDQSEGYYEPWRWYLRNYTNVTTPILSDEDALPTPGRQVYVVNANNARRFEQNLQGGYSEGRRVKHRWWFNEGGYRELTARAFFGSIFRIEDWRHVMDFFLYRKKNNPIGGVDSYVYFSDEIPLRPIE